MVPNFMETVPMIAPIKRSNRIESAPTWHAGFIAMLPRIKEHAEVAFRGLPAEAREDAIHETVANAMVAFRDVNPRDTHESSSVWPGPRPGCRRRRERSAKMFIDRPSEYES